MGDSQGLALQKTQSMVSLQEKVSGLLKDISKVVVSMETLTQSQSNVALLKGFAKVAENCRTKDKERALAECRFIDDAYATLLKPITDEIARISRDLASVMVKENERIAKEQKKVDVRAERKLVKNEEKGITSPIPEAVPLILSDKLKSVKTEMGTSTLKDNWSFRITDATKIKNEFLIPDGSKILSIVKTMKKDAETIVGGIQVWNEPIISTRAKNDTRLSSKS